MNFWKPFAGIGVHHYDKLSLPCKHYVIYSLHLAIIVIQKYWCIREKFKIT